MVLTMNLVEPVEVAVDSDAARGAEPAGAGTGGAEPGFPESEGAEPLGAEPERMEPRGVEPGGAESRGAESGGAELERAEPGGAEPGGAESGGAAPRGAEPERAESGGPPSVPSWREPLSPQQLREWYTRCCRRAARGAAGDASGAAGGAAGAGAAGAAGPRGAGAGGTGAVGGPAGVGAAGGAGAAGPGGARIGGAGAVDTGGATGAGAAGGNGPSGAAGVVAGDPGAEGTGAVSAVYGGAAVTARPRPYYLASPLPGPSPYSGPTRGLTERREPESRPPSPESRPASPESHPELPVCPVCTGRRIPRPRPPPVPGTHSMNLRPSTAPQHVPPPSPPASSLAEPADPESDSLCTASPTVTRLLATVVTNPFFESTAASALVAELVDFAAHCRLDYAASLVAESESASVCPPSIAGECALGTDVLEDRQEEFECFAPAVPHLVSSLLAPEGDLAAMDAEMASLKSTGTYVDEVPPPGAKIGVDFFQTFSPTPKMTTLRVLLHVAAQRDYELHSLDFRTAYLQGSLHEEIWLCRPPGFTGSFPSDTQWSLWRPVYGLRQAPREWHDTLRTTLAALGFAPSTADPSLFLHTDATLPPFYVLVYVDDLVFATANTKALAHVKSELQKRHTCTDLGELTSYLGLRITRDRAQRTITLTLSHMVQQVLSCLSHT
ncbi:unnamed protein product [Closterium sp. NIES-54]